MTPVELAAVIRQKATGQGRLLVALAGPPGAGKGTQAKVVSARLHVPHISTGDIFRANVRDETPLGVEAKGFMDRGEYVPEPCTHRPSTQGSWEYPKSSFEA